MQADFLNEFDFCDFLAVALVRFDRKNVLKFFRENSRCDVFTRRVSDHVGHFAVVGHKVKNDFHGFLGLGFERLRVHLEHLKITRAAKASACDSYGQAKQ